MRDHGKPRVLHIVPALFGVDGILGGAERYALELAKHMADVIPTRMLTFGNNPGEEKVGNLSVRVVGNPRYVRGQRGNPISAAILGEVARVDVIHCHQQHILASSVAAAFSHITGRKVFVTDLGGGGWDISAFINTDRWYHGHLHISEYSRRVSKHEQDRRSHVILGGVDTTKFSPDPSATRDGSMVFVGRLLPHKGINYLIEAAPPGMSVKIIGQPMHEQYLRELHSLAEGKCVSFYHDYSDQQIVQAYRSALCVVLPSVYRTMHGDNTAIPELLGQTLLEGMACGIPALCTNVASMPEIVHEGRSGFVVPPNDARALREKLVWLNEHRDEARVMGQNARARVLHAFTWPRVVERCLEIYAHS